MNLCREVVSGLMNLGNSNEINDDCFEKLLDSCVSVILENEEHKRLLQIGILKHHLLKEALASLILLLIQGSRQNISNAMLLSNLTQDFHFLGRRTEKFMKCYSENKNAIQGTLSHIGSHSPHIVDAYWTTDVSLKESRFEHPGPVLYLIQIRSESCDVTVDSKKATNKIKFLCTFEELQNFVNKLKDTIKQVERLVAV